MSKSRERKPFTDFSFFLVISGQQDPDRSFIEKKGLLNLSIYPLVRFELVVTKH